MSVDCTWIGVELVSQPKHTQYLIHLPLPLYSHFPAELASILLLAFLLFALVATLSQCLCSESPYLSIKLICIYICFTNVMLYIAYYPQFHATTIGLGMYYPWIWGHYSTFGAMKQYFYLGHLNIPRIQLWFWDTLMLERQPL
jgi:hypothetical protein